jgi:transcriptional regulator GlxA family with amidase domain
VVKAPRSRKFESAKGASGLCEDAQTFLSRLALNHTQGVSMQNILQVDGQFPGNRRLKVERPDQPGIDRRIRAVVEHLHANLCMRISVADLARSVNMSRWYFCHLFKAEMSQSPSHYMRTLKMREAQRMLLETFLSVKEIRATLGNIDRSHFSREFRNYCGLTPTEFRRRLNMSQPHDSTHYASK